LQKEAVRKAIKRLTKVGVLKYGLMLCSVEGTTIASIYMLKQIIDFLGNPSFYSLEY